MRHAFGYVSVHVPQHSFSFCHFLTKDYIVLTRSSHDSETIVTLSAPFHCAEDYVIPLQTYSSRGIPQSRLAALTQEALDPSCHIIVLVCFVTF